MTVDHVLAITPASELLWRAVIEFLRAVAADAEPEFLRRLQGAAGIAVSTQFVPEPRIVVTGIDANGAAFERAFEIIGRPRDLN